MPIYSLGDVEPVIASTAFVHPDAVVIGNVTIGDAASVWPCAVLRGDYGHIEIGARTSIQDGAVVHAIASTPTVIGSDCVVGHTVHMEACVVKDHCLIGSGSLLLPGVLVEMGALVAAGAVVREGTVVRAATIVAGVPASERGPLTERHQQLIDSSIEIYLANAKRYKAELRRMN